jgi:repressor LexA
MIEELTPKQQKILNFVRKSIEKTGFPPTRIEISKAFNYSSANAAEEHLRMLERKGAIELTPGASRGIRLTEGLGLPLVGRVAAGSPILAEEHVERPPGRDLPCSTPTLPAEGPRHEYARRRADGDLLAVHRTRGHTGQIVVARPRRSPVKRLRRRGNVVELLPELSSSHRRRRAKTSPSRPGRGRDPRTSLTTAPLSLQAAPGGHVPFFLRAPRSSRHLARRQPEPDRRERRLERISGA